MSEQDLPLPDYDHVPVGSLQHRVRSLNEGEVRQLLDYERQHNDRPQVVEVLLHRLDELEHGETPSPGTQDSEPVEAQSTRGGSPVTPSGSPQAAHPPPHGTTDRSGHPKANRNR